MFNSSSQNAIQKFISQNTRFFILLLKYFSSWVIWIIIYMNKIIFLYKINLKNIVNFVYLFGEKIKVGKIILLISDLSYFIRMQIKQVEI